MTVNKSGPTNRSPLRPWTSCAVTILVDDLIKDKWIAPEDRFQEIAQIYKGQTQQLERVVRRLRLRIAKMEGKE
jgi:hypothetical protein